ncbi:hypothetical protein DVK02_08150 [Halobellus sp. Atlit-31R]|nr:hypothetical protein DVK02_08150 [Halobellus sp. Atlit-31R]
MVEKNRNAAERVVVNVAEAAHTDASALPPLYEAVDPDALNDLVESTFEGAISFSYAGCTVTVDGDGDVTANADAPAESATVAVGTDRG